MIHTQKYEVYNRANLTGVLIQAQTQRQLVEHLAKIKPRVDSSAPATYQQCMTAKAGRERHCSRPQLNRQRDIDNENTVLLNKIMKIMKRKNKSVAEARSSLNKQMLRQQQQNSNQNMAMHFDNSEGGVGDYTASGNAENINGNNNKLMHQQVTDGSIVKGQQKQCSDSVKGGSNLGM